MSFLLHLGSTMVTKNAFIVVALFLLNPCCLVSVYAVDTLCFDVLVHNAV